MLETCVCPLKVVVVEALQVGLTIGAILVEVQVKFIFELVTVILLATLFANRLTVGLGSFEVTITDLVTEPPGPVHSMM